MKKELLTKYLNNRSPEKEFEEFVDWVQHESFQGEGKSWMLKDWESFCPDYSIQNKKKYNRLLDKIHHQINLGNYRSKEKSGFNPIFQWLVRAAAILFIPLLGIFFYTLLSKNNFVEKYADLAVDSLEIIAPIGSRTMVQLSDGTEVNLNYGSKIKYPMIFNEDKREITLVGEAYFAVAHNPEKPFIVKTAKLNVKALGTEFNLNAYPGSDIVATTLVKGKVVIEKILPEKKVESIVTMVPGQHTEFNIKSGRIISIEKSVQKYIAWKDGKLVFDNEPITGVAESLSRMFNVDIEVNDNVKDFTYTVTFENDPLFLILDLMTEITPIKYKVFPRRKLPDGAYSKQKISIEKR